MAVVSRIKVGRFSLPNHAQLVRTGPENPQCVLSHRRLPSAWLNSQAFVGARLSSSRHSFQGLSAKSFPSQSSVGSCTAGIGFGPECIRSRMGTFQTRCIANTSSKSEGTAEVLENNTGSETREESGNGNIHTLREKEEVQAEEQIGEEETAVASGAEQILSHLSPPPEGNVLGLSGAETSQNGGGNGVDIHKVGGEVRGKMREEVKERWKPVPPPITGEPIPVAQPDLHSPPWTSQVWCSPVDYRRKIFCNRSLNMKSIKAVGFDMDYTLAQYKPDTFETLAYHETIKKLVNNLGYPKDCLDWKFDWRYMVRGLAIDKRRGNILKMDRHKYVKIAYHGFREMPRDKRLETYGNAPSRDTYDEPDYALIDTLFSLAEAYLFAQLVDLKDEHPELMPPERDYATLYKDVRAAVDLCHRDGSLKRAVAADPEKYIYKDEQIVPMLDMIRKSGRSVFLVTNSLWDYTHVVMNYLCGKSGREIPRDDKWLQYFDVVIVGSCKPAFFMEGNRSPIFEVDPPTGFLSNTDNGSPMVQVGEMGERTPHHIGSKGCRTFQGGTVAHLHSMIGVQAGAQILYVGDHIYGDILRSKKQLGWRTMLVVPELEKELLMLQRTAHIREVLVDESRVASKPMASLFKGLTRKTNFDVLRHERDSLDDTLQRLDWALKHDSPGEKDREAIKLEMAEVKSARDRAREEHRLRQKRLHESFHPVWGQLMKTGYQNSRFAHQVERFACLYTSHVGNLCYYSPEKSYRTQEDILPHEVELLP